MCYVRDGGKGFIHIGVQLEILLIFWYDTQRAVKMVLEYISLHIIYMVFV